MDRNLFLSGPAQRAKTSGRAGEISPLTFVLLLAAYPAVSQQADQSVQSASPVLEEVSVTGTRIRSPNLESPNPIVTLSAKDLESTGKTSVQEMVSVLGALVGSQGNSEVSSGENVLVLRNLGPSRTLVLVDGQRFVGGAASSQTSAVGATAVDTNVIPAAMIERVDVLTGGASAIYGADAVTGVVNFILKKNFEGVAFDGQFGNAFDGAFRDQVYSLTAGHNFFDDGRANLTFNYTYGERPLTLATARAQSSAEVNEQINNQNGSIPRYVLAPGTRESFFTDGGAHIDPFGIFSTGFNGDGTPFQHGINVGSFAGTGEIGGDGIPNWKLFAQGIRPGNRRHIFTLSGHYDVTDRFQPYFNAHFSDITTRYVDQETLTVGMPVARDNAFLPASVLAAAPEGAPIFFNRWDLDSGYRNVELDKQTVRIVLGAKGDITSHWRYDLSGNFGRIKRHERTFNNRMFDRYIAAIDSVVDPLTGKVTCRSNIDPASFERLQTDFLATTFDPSRGPVTFNAGPNSGCVPFNPFTTDNALNDAARAWIWIPTDYRVKDTQTVVQGFIEGDTGAFFELPGGPVKLVLGAEYRKEQADAEYDEFSGSPTTVAAINGASLAGQFSVKEEFAEVSLPLLGDVHPALRGITLDGAFRYSDYTTIGTTSTWNLGANIKTWGGLTLRGTVSTAVRAPNVQELFTPRSNTSVSLGQFDPCSTTNVVLGSATRQANCAAALSALGVNPATFDPLLGTYFSATTGGNPNLREETAHTKTYGVVWQPSYLPELIVTADYFDIRLDNAVLLPDTSAIFNACYDAPTLENVFCSLIQRQPGTGVATFVQIQSVNVAELKTSGAEFGASYGLRTERAGNFRFAVSATWLRALDIQTTPLPILTDEKGLFSTDTGGSSPTWVVNPTLAWSWHGWDLTYGVNYSSRTLRPPLINAQRSAASGFIDHPYVKAFVNHDLQVGYAFGDGMRVYGGIRNLTDEYPDRVRGSLNGPSGAQGFAGRSYYIGVNMPFGDVWRH